MVALDAGSMPIALDGARKTVMAFGVALWSAMTAREQRLALSTNFGLTIPLDSASTPAGARPLFSSASHSSPTTLFT